MASIAIGQPGNTGTVIGSVSSASSSGTPVNPQKATAIRQGAERVKSGSASKAEISAVIAQSHLPGINPLLNAAVARANQALQASDLP